jgi:hypothetical protein
MSRGMNPGTSGGHLWTNVKDSGWRNLHNTTRNMRERRRLAAACIAGGKQSTPFAAQWESPPEGYFALTCGASTRISTRRFSLRPALVLLSAAGSLSPRPSWWIFTSGTCRFTVK